LKKLILKELTLKELIICHLTSFLDQLSKVKTLYDTKLDQELFIPLKEKYSALFEVPDYEE
jgi:hypothetical protein